MKKRNEENHNIQEDHDEQLSAEELKELNRLLERLHQKDYKLLGNININIYKEGSLHVDHVDNQYLGDKLAKALLEKEQADSQPPFEQTFDDRTPLSALFRKNHHEELRQIIASWRPYLIDDDSKVDALSLSKFHFDFTRTRPVNIYVDFAHLINHDALYFPMSVLANYLFQHSNLSISDNALYVQLKRYKKLCK